jgi:hypothetical protein
MWHPIEAHSLESCTLITNFAQNPDFLVGQLILFLFHFLFHAWLKLQQKAATAYIKNGQFIGQLPVECKPMALPPKRAGI